MAVNPMLVGGIGVGVTAAAVTGGLYAGGVIGGSKADDKPDRSIVKPLISIKAANSDATLANDKAKFGGKFSYYFLSTTSADNNAEWNKRVKQINENKPAALVGNSFFNDVKTGGSAKLKEICGNKYKETWENQTSDDDKAKWKEVWIYCSLIGTKPTTITEATTTVSTINDATTEKAYTAAGASGKFGITLKGSAISIYDPNNADFWTRRNEEFKAGGLDEGGQTNSYFNKDGNSDIKTLCKDAYEKTTPSNPSGTEPTEANIKKYCSIEKTT